MWTIVDGVLQHETRPRVRLTPAPGHRVRSATLPGVDFVLDEWAEYTLGTDGEPITAVLGVKAQEFAGERQVRRLQFSNQVGTATIIVETAQGATAPLRVEVLSPKFPSESLHQEFLTAVLDDLRWRTRDAAFVAAAPTAVGSEHDPRGATILSDFHVLQALADKLQEAVAIVTANPHRVLRTDRQEMPLTAVTAVDSDVVSQLVTRAFDYQPVVVEWPIVQRLKGALPRHVVLDVPEESLDTPENRFVVRLLDHVDEAIRQIEATAWLWEEPASQSAHHKLRDLRQALQSARATSFLAALAPATTIPYMSQVLRRRAGYQECWEVWQSLMAGRWGIFGQAEEAIASRNIAKLYELWAFFALADQLGDIIRVAPTYRDVPRMQGGARSGAEARLGAEWRLVYDQTIAPPGSYSHAFRPDYTLYRGGDPLIAFDAKFRFDVAAAGGSAEDLAGLEAKSDDLDKMHTYRDAIRGLQAAVVVFPGSKHQFFHRNGEVLEAAGGAFPLEDLLDGAWDGIGAIALRPRQMTRSRFASPAATSAALS